jgi:5-methylcytosine-specific restriction endonuclease McrA
MTNKSPTFFSDRDLLDATARAVEREQHATADLLALLGELDSRKLYLGEGFSSLFTYCNQALHLSEPAAYSRITAARVARRFPIVLRRLADGEVNLTTVTLLAGHLTDENHEALINAARHKTKREVEHLVASLDPQPDVDSSLRKVLSPSAESGHTSSSVQPALARQTSSLLTAGVVRAASPPVVDQLEPVLVAVPHSAPRPVVAPLAPERYLIKITVGRDTHAKLERARDLLRHTIPTGDPAAIIDRALTALVEQLERTKSARVARPRAMPRTVSHGRHIPASVKRAVWARDEGRCAFVGNHGRCAETGFLEFHHVVPFAIGGATDAENLELRCRAHNAYEADRFFGTTRSREAPTTEGPA